MSNTGTGPVVSFENVSKHYGSLKAVDGLSLDLRPGETVALLGPNGAGKSTSLDMLLALRKPTAGRIRMFGSDPYHAIKSGRVGAMLQSGGLMPEVTVRELVTPGREPAPAAGAGQDDAEAGRHRQVRRPARRPAVRRPDAAGQVRARDRGRVRADRARRADDGDGRGDQAAVLGEHEGRGRRGPHAAVRDPLPGRGRPGGRPHPGDQPGPAARRRHPGRDQEAGRRQADVVPARARWTSRSCSACPAWSAWRPGTTWCTSRPATPTRRCTRVLDAGYRPSEIEVASLGLEQAFLAITVGRRPRQRPGPGDPPRERTVARR